MSLLELAQEIGLNPRKTSHSRGGEYHCACPDCKGTDRFMFWPEQNQYWCRQCGKGGDSIKFCRDFLGLGYKDACLKLGETLKFSSFYHFSNSKPYFFPNTSIFPPLDWMKYARAFATYCHKHLLKETSSLQKLFDRGFFLETIKTFYLGWNPSNFTRSLSMWGLSTLYKEDGTDRVLWLPKGIVIPFFVDKEVIKLKIRRSEWKIGDKLPKYTEVLGSMKRPSLFGDISTKIAVIVESELDAMLIWQFARDVCCCIALGGAGKKPDTHTHKILYEMSVILFALDFDDAGKKAFTFWKSTYPIIKAWPIPSTKSPGDALKEGVDLRQWILLGLKQN